MAGAVMKRTTPYNRLIRFQLREENVIGSGIEKMLLSHPEDICSADEIALSHKLDCVSICVPYAGTSPWQNMFFLIFSMCRYKILKAIHK
jgi:hypothetical protein